ncbi:MAG: 30S ribosomal protein S6 [Tissierellia bacterium]|nr:30S ribosomal protein S6 [Tissierellia bacterium]
MREYEIVMIFEPSLEEEKRKQLMERLQGIIVADGKVLEVNEWGMRKLAYLINDIPEGYYVYTKAEATPAAMKEYDRVAKILDGIMRHMIVKIED